MDEVSPIKTTRVLRSRRTHKATSAPGISVHCTTTSSRTKIASEMNTPFTTDSLSEGTTGRKRSRGKAQVEGHKEALAAMAVAHSMDVSPFKPPKLSNQLATGGSSCETFESVQTKPKTEKRMSRGKKQVRNNEESLATISSSVPALMSAERDSPRNPPAPRRRSIGGGVRGKPKDDQNTSTQEKVLETKASHIAKKRKQPLGKDYVSNINFSKDQLKSANSNEPLPQHVKRSKQLVKKSSPLSIAVNEGRRGPKQAQKGSLHFMAQTTTMSPTLGGNLFGVSADEQAEAIRVAATEEEKSSVFGMELSQVENSPLEVKLHKNTMTSKSMKMKEEKQPPTSAILFSPTPPSVNSAIHSSDPSCPLQLGPSVVKDYNPLHSGQAKVRVVAGSNFDSDENIDTENNIDAETIEETLDDDEITSVASSTIAVASTMTRDVHRRPRRRRTTNDVSLLLESSSSSSKRKYPQLSFQGGASNSKHISRHVVYNDDIDSRVGDEDMREAEGEIESEDDTITDLMNELNQIREARAVSICGCSFCNSYELY